MPRFFLSTIDASVSTAYIEGDDAKHITKVLHAKLGQEFVLSDARGTDYLCAVRKLDTAIVTLDILSSQPCQGETEATIRLYQALPKGDKLEFIIQKAVELGVSEITPVLTSRCISRPSHKAMDKKLERLQRIAYEAAKQCGRGIIPRVMPLLEIDRALVQMAGSEMPILLYEESRQPLSKVLRPNLGSVSIMVGSEGGFSQGEVDFATNQGVVCASLGRRILRCETAPIAALSVILCHLGEL
ncbi:MAG: 16S rRNA (uracil(1498)-N(3))-methyltransferase [Oscillospiraceae bacterium]|nr:16S rRNA (uracil(1498)-N(3))-methyltransferase [Oscillospiraceae bacterium]